MLVLYDNSESANGYKVRLLASFLDIPLEVREVDIFRGEAKRPDYLRINPLGQIPALVLPDGRALAESNAILCYLAEGTAYLPGSSFERAQVLSWLFFEQYSHEPYVATPRFILRHTSPNSPRRAELEWRLARGRRALGLMNDALEKTQFLTGQSASIADISLFGYTHRGHECGIDLGEFPAVQRWIGAIEDLPNFVAMVPPDTLTLVD